MKKKYEIRNTKYETQKGFTVLESIVAIMILSLGVSGAFSAIQQSLSQSIIAKDEVKAFYLAQEAIEIIRNKRDNNQLAIIGGGTNNWLSGIAGVAGDPCYFGKTCRADATGPSSIYLYSCSGGWDSCSYLSQNQTTYIYAYSGTVSNFRREIQIESVNVNEIMVTVRVSWKKGLINKEFKIKTHLFNWI